MASQIIVIQNVGDITLESDFGEDGPVVVKESNRILPIQQKNILSEEENVCQDAATLGVKRTIAVVSNRVRFSLPVQIAYHFCLSRRRHEIEGRI